MSAKKRPTISASRLAEIFREMVEARREFCGDVEFFKAVDVWEWLAEGGHGTKISTYKPDITKELKLRAGVVVFEDQVTLVADERLLFEAKKGCKQANFVLAHELGHLGLNHHLRGTVVKNFQLFSRANDIANTPPTMEELEANYAAVFFQCGVALLDERFDTIHLAHRAFTDVYTLKKVRDLVRLDSFKRELFRPRKVVERVVL